MLYLVRHARPRIDPSMPPHEWALDPAGAGVLDELVALPCFAGAYRVVSSTEPKAVGTAAAIVKRHSLPAAEPMDALREVHKTGFVDDYDAVMVRLFREPDQAAAALTGQGRVNPADWRAVGMPDLAVVDAAARRVVQPFGAWRVQTGR